MNPSKVYFTDFHATPNETLLQKLHRLMKTAGFEQIDFTDKFTAIKLHFGEMGTSPSCGRIIPGWWPIISRPWAAGPSSRTAIRCT